MRERVCVYNNSFFLVSETFMYHQVKSLSDSYDITLIAKKFENPHGYDLDSFEKVEVEKPANIFDRVAGKLIRTVYKSDLDIGLSTFLQFRRLFRNGSCKAIHAHFGPNALDILGFAKKFNVPLVVTFHGYDASQLLKNQAYVDKLPELFEYASAIIIVSGHMIQSLQLEKWKDKVYLVPCSVEPTQFNSNGRVAESKSDVIKILHSGRLVGKKGVTDLIRVFRELSQRHDNIELHIAGDGKELDACKALVKEFNIGNLVTFYGSVSHDKVKQLMAEADIFVLNSRTAENGDMEGTPVTILEAMCMGKAVVSTKHAGIPYVIEHEKNGLLAAEYANDELMEQIERLITSVKMRSELGEEAKETVKNSFSTSIMRKKIQQIFTSI